MGVLLTFLCYDLPWAIAGLRRLTEIVSEPGTVNNALSPAGASMASTTSVLSTMDVVAHAFAKMLITSERYRVEAQASWTPGHNGSLMIARTHEGAPRVGAITDFFSGGGGARTFADGIDTGGIFHSMASQIANAETVESRVPALQLYRREQPDTGGQGRYRGGVAMEFATMAHKLPNGAAGVATIGSGVGVPAGRGLSGGAPGAAAANVVLRGSNVREVLAAGTLPISAAELSARETEVLEAKSFTHLEEGDVLIGVLAGGAGVGDPLRRSPDSTARDVRDGLVSEHAAHELYGVVIRDGAMDLAATEHRREGLRLERIRQGVRQDGDLGGGTTEGGTVLHPVSDTVEAVEIDGARSLRCTVCHYRFGPYEHDHKRSARVREIPLVTLNRHNGGCLPEYVAREFCCPGCGTALAVDVQHADEPPLAESTLRCPGAVPTAT